MSGKGGAKKKWTKVVNKEKRDWATVLLTEISGDVEKNVPRSKLITPAKLAEKYKISLTVAKKVLKSLEADGKLVCLMHHHTLCAYGRPEGAEEIVEEVVEEKTEKKGKTQKGGNKKK